MNNTVPSETGSHINAFLGGSSQDAYTFFGAHPARQEEQSGWLFRVWAPNAVSVHVAGPFNGWTADNCPMTPLGDGVWSCFVPDLETFESYQYIIETRDGETLRRSDPFAFHSETRPGVCSKLFDVSGYRWNDKAWMAYRNRRNIAGRPLSIYELHLGSWRRTGEGGLLSYRDIAKWLVPYVKEMGFSAVELMPPMEHSEDGSWGYETFGYFAATSRFGTPHDLMYLIDQLHQAGVIVLLDWVPAFFSDGEYGLSLFDGTACYEHPDPKRAKIPDRTAKAFDFGRPEVRSFLTSCAMFWVREYHVDGLRFEGLTSMLFLDWDGRPWVPNAPGGREHPDGAGLLRHLNTVIRGQYPAVLTIAGDTADWPCVTDEVETDQYALGFTFRWNTRWARSTLHYAGLDPVYRQYNHSDLTGAAAHAFDGKFILPLSHEEIVRRKQSFLQSMAGEDELKFAGMRAVYLYMLTHPGKKLVMMGTEFGQMRAWDYNYSLDWHLLGYQPFRGQQAFFRAANRFYLANAPLWALDESEKGFEWICPNDEGRNIIAYLRKDEGGECLLTVLNFSPVERIGYRVGVPRSGCYQAVFHTDSTEFGGGGRISNRSIPSAPIPCHDRTHSVLVDLPPLSGVVLKRTGALNPRKRKAQ